MTSSCLWRIALPQPPTTLSVDITADRAYIMTAALPRLVSQELTDTVNRFMADCHTRSHIPGSDLHFSLLMRRTGVDEYIQGRFDAFSERITAERQNDPSRAWVHSSPNALAFTMGTLVHDEHRPNIGNRNIYPSQIVISG
jgi:hypothetical protein